MDGKYHYNSSLHVHVALFVREVGNRKKRLWKETKKNRNALTIALIFLIDLKNSQQTITFNDPLRIPSFRANWSPARIAKISA
ncbi:hypothetical protein CCACVL1_04617 [Corchorus capsularis]|uniref:Uncharacterized protein n=1 Tax=Corchorus capsularis TaxID=210143 RepID=A0A1R3JR91_COCAP|nr:hypothetical protein CCACVL1_04617 [Corchorus capsularis]